MAAKDKKPTTEQYIEQEQNDRAKIRHLLTTEGGKVLIAWMERQYGGSMVKRTDSGVDIYQTAINIGAREVLVDLLSIRDTKDREDT
jgi:hypothetical protein